MTRYDAEKGNIQLALTGETLMSRRLSTFQEERFLQMLQLLREADVAFTNAEGVFQDHDEDAPFYLPGGGGASATYLSMPSWCIKELQWAGINMVSCANNHCSDFGEGGYLTNLRHLDAAGMTHAGTGRNLSEATAPAYLDTKNGRVALIGAADWGDRYHGASPWGKPLGVIAGEQGPHSRGRPGVNLLRYETIFTVDRTSFDALRRTSEKLRWDEERARHRGEGRPEVLRQAESATEITFRDTRFVLGEKFSMTTVLEKGDLDRNLRWVREARRMADWVLVTHHNEGATDTQEEPSPHAVQFAHAVIDEGADVFIGHGPHRDRGIEIYKGKPVFHSLGDFILQNDTMEWVPFENYVRQGLGWESTPADFQDARRGTRSGVDTRGQSVDPVNWESFVARVSFKGRRLDEVRLYPTDLGFGLPRYQRGRAVLAEPSGEVCMRVLQRLQRLSKPYGTTIRIENGLGIISGQ